MGRVIHHRLVNNLSIRKASFSDSEFPWLASFLDRTVAARRAEIPLESATGIIPGNRGKVGGSWFHHPLSNGQPPRGIYHQLL
jgi:hypothetical protein